VQTFVCPFMVQMQDERRLSSVKNMRRFLADYVIVNADPEVAGSAPRSAGEDATVSLAADTGNLTEVPPEPIIPISEEDFRKLVDKKDRLRITVAIDFGKLACISQDGTYDGLNDWVDGEVFGQLPQLAADLEYRPLYVKGNQVFFEVDCDVSAVLDELNAEHSD